MSWAAIDIGTSSVKGARFDDAGTRVAEAVRAIPAPQVDGAAVTQDLAAILTAADAVRDVVAPGATGLAVTTQRDTAAVGSTLYSWMDARPVEARDAAVFGLEAAVLHRWTGRAAHTTASASGKLTGVHAERLVAAGCVLPDTVELGTPAGSWNGIPVYPTAGDKNCALLANGASHTVAGLSLGSAVSLGLRAKGTPDARPGVFLSRSAIAGAFDVETGLVAGMSARRGLAEWLPIDRVPADFVENLWMLPHFAGALDRAATGAVIGLTSHTTPLEIAAAWTQGVVAELVRLRPVLEAVSGGTITRIRISGGGAQPGWDALVADGFEVPVERVHGRFAGCRGAIDAVRIAQGIDALPAGPAGPVTTPENPDRFARWCARYVGWVEALSPSN